MYEDSYCLCKSGFLRCNNRWYDISLAVCLELVTIAYWDSSNILHIQFPSLPSSANAFLIELCVVHDCTLQFCICLCWINEAFLFPLSCSLEQKPGDVPLQGGLSSFGWWGTRVTLLVFGILNFQWGAFSSLGAVLGTAFLLFAPK